MNPLDKGLGDLLLYVQSAVIAVYLVYALGMIRHFKNDPNLKVPQLPFTLFLFGTGIAAISFLLSYEADVARILLAFEISIGLALGLMHPAFGFGFFVLLLCLRPWELIASADSLFMALPRISGMVAIFSMVLSKIRTRSFEIVFGPAVLLLMFFAIWVFISTFAAGLPELSRQYYLDVFVKSVMVFLIAIHALPNDRSQRFAVGSLISGVVGMAILALVRTESQEDALPGERLTSFGLLADPNDLASLMVLATPFFMIPWLRKNEHTTISRIFSVFAFSLTLVLLFLAKSRGALLSLLVMGALYWVLREKKKARALYLSLMVGLMFFPLAALFQRSESDLAGSSEGRLVYWQTAIRMVKSNPLFGMGLAGYAPNFERFTPKFIESGSRTAHSSWFLALGETGPMGLVLFFAFCAYVFSKAWAIRKEHPEYILSMTGYGITMSFLSHTFLIYPYLLAGLVMSKYRMSRSRIVEFSP